MAFILDGNSEIGAPVESGIGGLICFKAFDQFDSSHIFFSGSAQRVLSYHLVYKYHGCNLLFSRGGSVFYLPLNELICNLSIHCTI